MSTLIENCRKVKIERASTPRNGLFSVYVDSFWIVTPDDEILFYNKNRANSPQCNSNEDCAKAIRDRLYPGFEVRQIPVIFVQIDPHDYM